MYAIPSTVICWLHVMKSDGILKMDVNTKPDVLEYNYCVMCSIDQVFYLPLSFLESKHIDVTLSTGIVLSSYASSIHVRISS